MTISSNGDRETIRARIPIRKRLINAVLCGAAAGGLAAILDTAFGLKALHSITESASLFFHGASRNSFFGGVGALLLCAAVLFSERLFPTKSTARSEGILKSRPVAWIIALLFSPGCVYVAWRLFQGGLTSRLPYRNALAAAASVVLLASVYAASRAALFFIERADRKTKGSVGLLIVGLLFVPVGAAAHLIDGRLYRRLYLYLHGVLGLVTLVGFGLFFRIVLFRLRENLRTSKLRFVICLALPLFFAASLATFGANQNVKLAAFENTATLADVLRLTAPFSTSETRGRPSTKVQEAQKERERKATLASKGDFPVFPGAHILLISVDALRADAFGIYGNKARDLTPRIDEWAKKETVIFDRAYCTAPHSSYSISAIHSGRFVHDEVMLNREINFPTVAEVLGRAGYETYAFYTLGIFFTEGEKVSDYRRNKFGFEHVFNGAPRPDELTDRAIAEIDRAVLKGEPPLFMWTHYFNVHEPYLSTKFGNSPKDRYDGEVTVADEQIGRLIEHAKSVLKKDLIVVVTADHGEEFKEHGGYYHGSSLYDEQTRIPLILHVPGNAAGRVMTPVSDVSLASTLLRLAGAELPTGMFDIDLRPALFGGDKSIVAAPVFAAVVNQHMAVSLPYKLIMDPTMDRYELYDLKSDPQEKFNLYDRHKEVAVDLRGEIEGFLDRLGQGESKSRTILNLGYMKDPRAVSGLVELLSDPEATLQDRVEAADLLGEIHDRSAVPSLLRLLEDKDERVATAAAFSLGRLGDMSGENILLDALSNDDPSIRDRAALVLGNRGEPEAAPLLIDALGRDDERIQEQALRALGKLRDPSTVEALLDYLDEPKFRYLTVLTLGMIGDMRAYQPLMDLINHGDQVDVKGYCVAALGWMEAKEAIPRLLQVAAFEPEIKWTPETLVRLGAVGKRPLFGTDIEEGAPALRSGWGFCKTKDMIITSEYLDRTSCETDGSRAEVAFAASAGDETILILRARLLEEGESESVPLREIPLDIFINGQRIGQAQLTSEFEETRLPVSKEVFRSPPALNNVVLKLAKRGRFAVDHVLVLAADEIPKP